MPVDHLVVVSWQRQQRGPVPHAADPDHLAVGAVDLPASDRQPPGERVIELGEGFEAAAGQHMLAHDQHLPLHPALGLRPVRGSHVDHEPVVVGERDRFGVQRHRLPGRDVPLDDGPRRAA